MVQRRGPTSTAGTGPLPRLRECYEISGGQYGGRAGKIITAETAEGAEMVGVKDLPAQPLRSPRALRSIMHDLCVLRGERWSTCHRICDTQC